MPIYEYPQGIADRTHLRIEGYKYSLPSLLDRTESGDVYQGVEIEQEKSLFVAHLYIPGNFGDSMSADWTSESIAFDGNAKDVGAKSNSALKEIASEKDGTLKKALNLALGIGQKTLTNTLANTQLGGFRQSIEAAAGARIAPNQSLIFNGAKNRELSLSFNFAPKNRKESEHIVKIIKDFRDYTTSRIADGILGNINIYEYPALFDITIVNGGADDTVIKTGAFIAYKNMACLNFDIKYSTNSDVYTHYDDNNPTDGVLSMQFSSLFPAFRKGVR